MNFPDPKAFDAPRIVPTLTSERKEVQRRVMTLCSLFLRGIDPEPAAGPFARNMKEKNNFKRTIPADWTETKETIVLNEKEMEIVQSLIDHPPEPTEALRKIMREKRAPSA